MRPPKELIGASTSLLVLSVLARGATYGYELVRMINEAADGLFVWQEGTIYPVLHRLEKDGLVRAKWEETEAGRRRKYYYITAPGRAALRGEAEQWAAFNTLVVRITGATHA